MSDSMLRFGLDVRISDSPMGFGYGNDVIGPLPEIRTLEQIRRSLRDPDCQDLSRFMPSRWTSRNSNIWPN